MGNIILDTIGTDGDVLPFIHIGHEMKRRGHSVTLLTHCYYEGVAKQAGFDFAAIDTELEYQQFIKDSTMAHNPQGFMLFFRKHVLPNVLSHYQLIEKLNKPGETVIVYRAAPGVGAWLAEEKLKIPRVSVFLAPSYIISEPFLETLYGSFVNDLNNIRLRLGLDPSYKWQLWWNSAKKNIGFWENWFAPVAADEILKVEPVGFITDTDKTKEIPEDVKNILYQDKTIVLINGSTGTLFVKSDFYDVSIRACQMLGYTGIVVTRHKELIPDPLPDGIYCYDHLPFSTLMPKVNAIIHHGGIGTSAQALTSGIPQLVLPVGADRPDNAARLQKAGVGEFLLPPQWKPDIVANALRRILESEEINTTCRLIAEGMEASNSIMKACDGIESVFGGTKGFGWSISGMYEDESRKTKESIYVDSHEDDKTVESDYMKLTEGLSQEKLEILMMLLNKENDLPYVEENEINCCLRVEGENSFPMSFAQERLWFLNQMEPQSPAYNGSAAFRIKGVLNTDALKSTFNEIISRNEILRTVYREKEGKPVQVVMPKAYLSLPVINLKNMHSDLLDEELNRIILEETEKPYDLFNGPVIRILLFKLEEDEHILFIGMHHIASDGWGVNIFVKEMITLYSIFSSGRRLNLKQLRIQYADYAKWQRKNFKLGKMDKMLLYWENRLKGSPSLLSLPLDYHRPSVQSYKGSAKNFTISKETAHLLKNISRQEGGTLFMTLLSVFKVLIYRYTNQMDIVVGTPIASRNRSELEDLIGFFVNTLVLRTQLDNNLTFVELLQRVKQTAMEAYENQDIPFERIVERLHLERNLSHTPLFQILFSLQNMPPQETYLEGVSLEVLKIEKSISQFDLSLHMIEEHDGSIEGTFEYNTDLFKEETIERFISHYLVLMENAIKDPMAKISDIPMLTVDEREQILQWNETKADFPKVRGIQELFEAQVEKTPEAIALIYQDQILTYSQLNSRANSLATVLREKGIKPDTIVGIMVERSLEMIVGIFGIIKAGGAYLPISPSYPDSRIQFMLGESDVKVLLTQKRFADKIDFNCEVVNIDDSSLYIENCPNPEIINKSGDLAYVIFTSGSTGKPKGVMIEHASLVNRLHWMQKFYPLDKGDTLIQKTPFTFDVSVWEIFWWSLVGARLCILEPESEKFPSAIVETVEKNKVSVIHFVPSMLNAFLNYVRNSEEVERLSSLRRVFCSGEALNISDVKIFNESLYKKNHTKMTNLYGPTEATVDVSYYDCPTCDEVNIMPIGKPIDNIKLFIVSNGELLPVGIPGEICISGIGLARGYLKRPDLTDEKFVQYPFMPESKMYRTGDIGRWLPDGNIEYIGRLDQQVKIRGFRIELGEIESVLEKHPMVLQVAVVIWNDQNDNKFLAAYIVPAEKDNIASIDLKAYLKEKVPEYMVPAYFTFLESMPLNQSGKIDRKALPKPDLSRKDNKKTYTPPETPVEEKLVEVWKEILGREKIGIHDNFFELGGDSILSIQIVSKALQAGIRLKPKHIFEYQTIAQLASIAEVKESFIAEKGPIMGEIPLTPIQHWFFEQNLTEPDHFNQSVLLKSKLSLDVKKTEITLKELVLHHDALRLRFIKTHEVWVQKNASPEESTDILYFDLRKLPYDNQRQEIEKTALKLHSSINISEGPIIRAALFNTGENTSYLFIVIHHLAVDGVSWRILIEDFENIYRQLEDN